MRKKEDEEGIPLRAACGTLIRSSENGCSTERPNLLPKLGPRGHGAAPEAEVRWWEGRMGECSCASGGEGCCGPGKVKGTEWWSGNGGLMLWEEGMFLVTAWAHWAVQVGERVAGRWRRTGM